MNPQIIRELTIKSFNEDISEYKDIVEKFKWFMKAYCADFKSTTEYDILSDDKLFNLVFDLFENAMVKNPESH